MEWVNLLLRKVDSSGATVGFNDSGGYLGGAGLTQTSLSGTDFYVVSQPSFDRRNTWCEGKGK